MSEKTKKITGFQIQRIHTLKSKLGMNDELYRDMLHAQAQVSSSKDLNYYQAADIIAHLEQNANELKVDIKPTKKKYDGLVRGNAYPSPAQLRLIEGLWAEKSHAPIENRAAALDKYIERIVGVSSITFLKKNQVQKIVKAIKNLKPKGDENVN